ncbi:SdiA-regulated [Hymenobacter daecheongensis DSM 21074]|uniref:SdiA-regulated n=1 Tax=Hymenobacter daecheongensis DSM 21074 TaxID=1121955 RepID=A0A1M6LUF4_9BACT|nr:SdiA-regulated domain-containing protein [Hymenobacter daecheongensis]SHJ74800.1 SdiA-regulated [Hymenobacter daecheongensis DSM 21074]
MKNRLLPFCLLLATGAATAQPGPASYDLSRPTATYALPPELREISGLALLPNQRVGCIEDQTGTIFIYNLRTRRIDKTLHFGKKGDYEDVARLKDGWLVLRSDGTLFKHSDQGLTTTYRTGLTAANNPEGLAYDAATNTLLVACKGVANEGQPDQKRAIYRLDPTTYRSSSKPAFLLDVAQLIALDQQQGQGTAINRFAPSAVAVQPGTRHIFVLAASGNALAELDAQGTPLRVRKLPRKRFPQPEGLAFAPNGDLYIASEQGDNGDSGLIQFFKMSAAAGK